MTAAVEVGVGYVSVVPSARGFANELQRQVGRSTVTVGARIGDQSGQAASNGMLSSLGAGLKAGLAGVAVAGAAVFTAAFTEAVEQDKSNTRLAAQLGLSPKEADRVGKLAGSIYAAGYGESVDQVNESLKTLAQNGVVAINAPRKDVEALTKATLNLSEAFGVDVASSARAAGQLVKTGLAADSKSAFDLITRGFQAGADKSEDFLDTLNEYGTQFRDLGLNGAQAIGLITQGLKAGARDGDIVADALKEFAIRSKDGSDAVAAGFKAIGLNAAEMTATFAKGGPGAAAGLDLVLDRLRAVPDPAKRSQTAVALFGTQAEDLQQSLFALDPSSAVGALGKVGGAATSMGKTLHSSATAEFEVFRRRALQAIVNIITRDVLPIVARLGSFLVSDVLPAIRAVANAFAAGVRWLQEYGAWLLPLGVAVAGLTITLNASAIATAAVTAVFSIYRAVLLTAAAVTRGYAIAQGILNAVMNANPIGLIITGIATLVTLLVVAYNKSDTFRRIVQATWAGIQAGWQMLWDNVLKPGFDGLMVGLRAVGTAAVWLWRNVFSPVFSAIGFAGKVLFAIIAVAVVAPLVIAFKALGAIGSWLWRTALKPAFEGIGALAVWLWTSAVRPALSAIGAFFGWLWTNAIKPIGASILSTVRTIGALFGWLWTNAVRPAISGIGTLAVWLYNNAIKPAATSVMATLRTLGALFGWLWTNAVRPAITAIGDKATWLYRVAIKPAMDRGRAAVDLFARGFALARDAIGRAWGQLAGIAKKPINFIIEWVYTKGIKKTWDAVADFVGLGRLPAAPKLLAAGGTVGPGWGPAAPMQVNRPTAIVGEGNPMHPEFVIPTDPKYRGRALAMWQAAGTQLMADGGIIGKGIDWLGGAAKSVGGAVMSGVDFLSDPSKMWEKATKFIRDKIAQIGQSRWAQMLGRLPLKMLGGLKDKIVKAAGSMFGGSSGDIGGSGVQRWSSVVLQALRMVGQPASLLPVVLRRMNQESGGNPRAINNWDINAQNGDPSRGLMQTIGSTFAAYAGPLRSRGIYDPLANIYASMRYALSRYGSLASAYNRPGGYAAGGRPRRGEWAWVGELGPELVKFGAPATVYPHDESVRMAAGMAGARAAASAGGTRLTPRVSAAAGAGGGLQAGDRLALRVGDREFAAYVEELADAVVEDTLIPVAQAIAGRRG